MEAVDQDEMEAIENLKATNEIVSSSYKNDLLLLTNKHKNLTTDHEQQKTQLIDALLSKDRLMKELASLKEQSGANGDDAYQHVQAKDIIEDEMARKALKDVSNANSASRAPYPPKSGGGFWKKLGRLSFRPHITNVPQVQAPLNSREVTLQQGYSPARTVFNVTGAQAVGHTPSLSVDQATLEDEELALQRERSAVGSLPQIPLPHVSPTHLSLPSTARVHSGRTNLSGSAVQRF